MPLTADREASVGKKKGEPKPQGTLVRASLTFAEAVREASSFEKLSVADFMDLHLLPIVQKRYKDAVVAKAKRMEGR